MLLKYPDILKFMKYAGLRFAVTLTQKYPCKAPSVLLAEGILPKVCSDDLVYEQITLEKNESPCIDVLLIENVPGLGSIGTLASVHRNRFWRYLYIKGLAELPTKERIVEMKSKQEEKPSILCGQSYVLQQHLCNMTLYIPMNPSREWILNKTHVKVAFRKYGIIIHEDSISLPTKQITPKNAESQFKVSVNIGDVVNVDVPCKIFLYQKIDNSNCTQPPTNEKINCIRRCLSNIRRRAYEPIQIKQCEGPDVKFMISDISPCGKSALVHFDQYYTDAYGPVAWPILYNRYFPNVASTIPSSFKSFLPNLDFIHTLAKSQSSLPEEVLQSKQIPDIVDQVVNTTEADSQRRQFLTRFRHSNEVMETASLNEFIPSTELIDYYGITEVDNPSSLQPLKVLTEKLDIPTGLSIKCSPPGRLTSIPDPVYVNGQFNFNVTGLLNRLACVVRSPSRATHVHQITETFQLPESSSGTDLRTKIDILCSSDLTGYISANINESCKFNKILVNVPCSADRYTITSDAVHFFGPGQSNARVNLSRNQLYLLRRAVSICEPGGDVLYSTSTLSPSQNQEIIQSFITKNADKVDFALVNLKPLYNLLSKCYSKLGLKVIPIHLPLFSSSTNTTSSDSCHALLLIPFMACNYGPTFIAKFRRLS
ncbi:unnamed protein product [Heterobilharzia americana]|nr:unnamed protein product [Heterobilharzia americana]